MGPAPTLADLPKVPAGEILTSGEGACPEEFAGCMSAKAAIAMRKTIATLLRYAKDAEATCGVSSPERDKHEGNKDDSGSDSSDDVRPSSGG